MERHFTALGTPVDVHRGLYQHDCWRSVRCHGSGCDFRWMLAKPWEATGIAARHAEGCRAEHPARCAYCVTARHRPCCESDDPGI